MRFSAPGCSVGEPVGLELRADPEALGRGIIRRIFELFNWNDPDEQMLRDWQQKLIQRTY